MSVNFVLHCSGKTSFTTKYIWLHRTNLCCRLSSVAEDTIRAYFESRLVLLEPVFPLACHRLCEGPDFSMDFTFKSQPQPEGNPKFLHYLICKNTTSLERWCICCFSVARQIHEFCFYHVWPRLARMLLF